MARYVRIDQFHIHTLLSPITVPAEMYTVLNVAGQRTPKTTLVFSVQLSPDKGHSWKRTRVPSVTVCPRKFPPIQYWHTVTSLGVVQYNL